MSERKLRRFGIALLAIVTVPSAYLVAGAVGGAVPVHRDWRPAAAGVTIFVESNGVHTGIVVPKVAAGVDWRRLVRARDLADPRYAAYDHLSFGWGERGFYLGTPTWAELRPGTVLAAALGSDDTLVHVEHLPRPVPDPDVRALVLRPEEYRRLAAFIAGSVAPDGERRHGYAGYDAFYQGRGHYDAIRTCNAWTGAALRHAGVRMGAWTPFPATVMQWL
ncbi:TIGR02117 family protein [Sphingomonas sp. KR1UV-12]|uniref:TIGR02117 family protein n=1 Tax=Sphingomonas aurea TaxID=3063994 RepID=A0ABT9EKN6_9SPHN|nr:TIGR02117 family protein [Sphingomonas sp. KR1UV-12]MDP1027397.1 TIGR02117 family protein [Sphingomonas sp. KR1UV-12]